MGLRELIIEVFENYIDEKSNCTTLTSNLRMFQLFNHIIPNNLREILQRDDFVYKGSCGKGVWTKYPWVAIMNKYITNTTQKGVYVVYLFSEDMKRLYLTLNQGCTTMKKSLGVRDARKKMREFSYKVRQKIESRHFSTENNLNIGEEFYEIGAIFSKEYEFENFPSEEQLIKDLKEIIEIYDEYYEKFQKNIVKEDGKKCDEDIKYWVIAPGENAKYWDEFLNEGIIGIGWDELGDLRRYNSKEEIKEKIIEKYGYVNDPRNNALANFDFAKSIKKGDYLFVKQGIKKLIGFGKVISDYIFDESRKKNKSIRKVEWIKRGE